MRKYFLLLLLLSAASQLHAQIAARILHLNPTGDQGVLFKKRISAELMYMRDFADSDDNWRFRGGISYAPLHARLDTFPSYAEGSNGTISGIFPGYEIYKKYTMQFIFFGYDYAVLDKHPLYLFVGTDILGGGVTMDYEAYYPTIIDESFSGAQVLIGLRFRGGVQYNLNDNYILFGEFNRSYYFIEENGFQSHYDFGIGLQYIFY